MAAPILIYGASGFSGGLIADVAARDARNLLTGHGIEVVLGGRDRIGLLQKRDDIRKRTGVTFGTRAFALDDPATVRAALQGFGVVINAAGPFARTALPLAKGAIATGCHYVDINGEADVYQAVDDLDLLAADRSVTLISGAGFSATVSDALFDAALKKLFALGVRAVGDVRIAMSCMAEFSQGSLLTMLRSVREEVAVVRDGQIAHVPVGRLERSFHYGRTPKDKPDTPEDRIASAVNVIDTLVAARTSLRNEVAVASIESYAEMSLAIRDLYQVAAFSAVLWQLPLVQSLTELQISGLPKGPDEAARADRPETVLLQIESPLQEILVNWRIVTPNAYTFTSRSALAVAVALIEAPAKRGWCTPAQVLPFPDPEKPTSTDVLSKFVFKDSSDVPLVVTAGQQAVV
jgi:short subunit dehydrogenase-like uncharacterized protein